MKLKKQLHLSPAVADLIGTGYICIKNAKDMFRTLNSQPDIPTPVRMFISGWVADLTILQDKLDRRLSCNELFEEEIKNNDTMRLTELNRLFLRFTKEQQEELEDLFIRINRGETFRVEEEQQQEHY